MTTILHIIERLTGSGPTRALLALVKAQNRLGLSYRHRVVTLKREGYPLALVQARQAGMDVVRAPDVARLRDEIAGADVVHVHFWNTPDVYAFLHTAWPAMRVLLHTSIIGNTAPQAITPALVEYADALVATTRQSLSLPAIQATSHETVDVIESFVDLDRLATFSPRRHATFNVGYIGTVNFSKLHPNYVAMSARIDVPDIQFVVCGGDKQDVLRQQAAALGVADRFIFRGFVEEIQPVLETLDVFGYPLRADTYATSELSLREAMSVGVPPVVFPYGGIADLVEHGRTGLVVQTEAEYVAAIEYLYQHPDERQRLGRAAADVIQQQFSMEAGAQHFDAVYQRLLAQPKCEQRWPSPGPEATPAARFVAALGDTAPQFARALAGPDPEAERQIAASSPLLASGEGGIIHYRNTYPDDPYLRYWVGLVLRGQGRDDMARREFRAAVDLGLDPTRAAQYLKQ